MGGQPLTQPFGGSIRRVTPPAQIGAQPYGGFVSEGQPYEGSMASGGPSTVPFDIPPPSTIRTQQPPGLTQEALTNMIERMFGPQMQQINHPVYRKPYPDYIDRDYPFPWGYKVPKFTLFSGDDKMFTLEHVARFTYQCGEVSENDFMKLKFFLSSLTGTAFNWYLNLSSNSIFTWWDMQNAF